MEGRVITNNAFITFEIFHSMKNHYKRRKVVVAMKLDMSKDFDSVELGFLYSHYGSSLKMSEPCMACVSSVNYSCIITSKMCVNVSPTRGLKYAGPLFTDRIFVLVADAFSHNY